MRSADAVGADGIIIGKHRSVSLTPTVAKVSTGAINSVPVCAAANLAQTLQYLKRMVTGSSVPIWKMPGITAKGITRCPLSSSLDQKASDCAADQETV